MLFGFVRSKLVAILVGPSGVGLAGVFTSIVGVATTVSGLGIHTSGVRDVANAYASGNLDSLGRTILTLRRICWLTGAFGFLALFFLAPKISEYTFGFNTKVCEIRLLAITVLLGNITAGQSAVIQGTRRIGDLARMTVWGALASTVVCVGFYWWLGLDGIVPAMLAISGISVAVSTVYSRRVAIPIVSISWKESLQLAWSFIGLGVAFVWSGLLVSVVGYLTNVMVSRELGLSSVGIYGAAYTLSGLFVQFVLQAMSADYYPRLAQAAADNRKMNALINEQTEVGILLAFPGLLGTLSLAPCVIWTLYTSEFLPATDLVRWFVLGCVARVISWPMGFAVLAKGKSSLFAGLQTFFHALHLLLIWGGINMYGLTGVAVAFFFMYFIHVVTMFIVARMLSGFTWTKDLLMLAKWMVPATILVFTCGAVLPEFAGGCVGLVASAASGVLCLRRLAVRVGPNHKLCNMIQQLPGGRRVLPKQLFSS